MRTATPVQGMGEPLNNYEQVRTATRSMINPTLFGLKRSKVTISTVGIIPRILQVRTHSVRVLFARKDLQPLEERLYRYITCEGKIMLISCQPGYDRHRHHAQLRTAAERGELASIWFANYAYDIMIHSSIMPAIGVLGAIFMQCSRQLATCS